MSSETEAALARQHWLNSIAAVRRAFDSRFGGSDGDSDQRLRPVPEPDDEDNNSIRM